MAIVVHGPLSPEVLYSRSTDKTPEPPLALQKISCRVSAHQDSPPTGDESEIETGRPPDGTDDEPGAGFEDGEVVADGSGVICGLCEADGLGVCPGAKVGVGLEVGGDVEVELGNGEDGGEDDGDDLLVGMGVDRGVAVAVGVGTGVGIGEAGVGTGAVTVMAGEGA